MPFKYGETGLKYNWGYEYRPQDAGSCDTSGNCTSAFGKAVWWPQFSGISNPPCASASPPTCIIAPADMFTLDTIIDYTSAGKQAIFRSLFVGGQQGNANGLAMGNSAPTHIFATPGTISLSYALKPISQFYSYIQNNINVYDPVENYWPYWNAGLSFIRYLPNILTQRIIVQAHGYFMWWATAYVIVSYMYEVSPTAIIPLDYNNDYLVYPELRRIFGYSYNGIDQPGWNASDIINVLKELFPDRAWMVYDDKDSTLYLWNVNFSDIPDWLLQKINPSRAKTLQAPSSTSAEQSLFSLLAQRNNVVQ